MTMNATCVILASIIVSASGADRGMSWFIYDERERDSDPEYVTSYRPTPKSEVKGMSTDIG
jgi:hypothetical protein